MTINNINVNELVQIICVRAYHVHKQIICCNWK